MKKILTALFALALLTGCTTSKQSYLDEKIKCKKLAEEYFENGKITSDVILSKKSNYSAERDSCVVLWKSTKNIQVNDLLTGVSIGGIEVSNENYPAWQEFESEMNRKYFLGENAK